ncbi:MAG TPA: hypothetical protein PKC88_07390, partial [Plasticicumulans sp.]|nr:hypothetical protein [Plasticicumulans sp.]
MSAALIHIADPSVPGGWRPATAADFAGTGYPQVYSEVVSLVGLAAGVTVYGSVIDLGAIRGQALVTALKSAGFNQSDAIAIQQSDDPLF